MATAQHLDDITECPICTEVYTDPRVLPCVHTFCLKCIREWSKDKHPVDQLACPLCRKEFAVPGSGVEDLPKNFFVTNFLQMKELTSVESKTGGCEACSGDGATEVKVATVYCVECQQKLCRACQDYHKKLKTTAGHNMIDLGDEVNIETLSNALSSSSCSKHKEDYLRVYCMECKVAICMICYMESHSSHICSELGTVADDFREQMRRDVENISASVDNVEKC